MKLKVAFFSLVFILSFFISHFANAQAVGSCVGNPPASPIITLNWNLDVPIDGTYPVLYSVYTISPVWNFLVSNYGPGFPSGSPTPISYVYDASGQEGQSIAFYVEGLDTNQAEAVAVYNFYASTSCNSSISVSQVGGTGTWTITSNPAGETKTSSPASIRPPTSGATYTINVAPPAGKEAAIANSKGGSCSAPCTSLSMSMSPIQSATFTITYQTAALPPGTPSLSSPTHTNVTSSSATLGATVTSLGVPASISARGVCYSSSATYPTQLTGGTVCTNASLTQNVPEAFTINASGLSASTTYYYNGYATNSTGTGYTPSAGTFTTGGAVGPFTLTVTRAGTGSGTVTGVSNPSQTNINCGASCSLNYSNGTTVTLSASATSGTFAGWSGEGCSGTGTCVVNMTQARNVTATFNTSPQPDLTAGSVSPTSASGGVAQTYTATITNSGSASTGASFSYFFQTATGQNGTGSTTDRSPSTMSTLVNGTNGTATSPSITFSSGSPSIRVCADKTNSASSGTITESNESNNCGAWTNVSIGASSYTATPSVSGGNGTITPSTPQSGIAGTVFGFTLNPNSGYAVSSVGGTCGGSLAGNSYTINPLSSDCTVIASFQLGNQSPSCSAGPDKAITLPTSSVAVTGTASDPDGSIGGLQWFPAGSSPLGSSPAASPNDSFTTTLQGMTVAGTYTFQINVFDNQGAFCSDLMSVVVSPPPMSGTISASNCTIASNASSCNSNLVWSTTNPVATSGVTSNKNDTGASSPNFSVATGNSTTPNPKTSPVFGGSPSGTRLFELYNNGQFLSASTATATCASGTAWSGSACKSYTVTGSAGSNGTVTPSTRSVAHGSTTTFDVTPDPGYNIGSVTGCNGSIAGNTYTTGAITANCTVTASFTLSTTPLTSVSISGQTIVGQTLTATVAPAGATATYQWQSSATSGGTYTNISGATNSTYVLTSTESGKYIKVVATGTGAYTGTVTSTASPQVGTMSGSLTASNCTIAVDSSSCNSNLVWSTTNPVATSGVTSNKNDAGALSPNFSVATGNSTTPNPKTSPVFGGTPNGTRIFYLYNNGVELSTPGGITATATCASGSAWNGTTCAANSTPVLSSPTSSNVTTSSATLGATITSAGTPATITERGTCWGTTSGSTTNCLAQGGTSTGAFTHARTGMPAGTRIYYKGYAINASGTGYSAESFFDTTASNTPPTVTSPTATSITSTSATLGANVTSLGVPAVISARGTCWGTSPLPTTNCLPASGTTTGVFTHSRTGLPSGATIYYRGYAPNTTGTGYSSDDSFSTSSLPDLTADPSTPSSATLNVALTFSATIRNTGGVTTGAGFSNFYQVNNGSGGAGGTTTDLASASTSSLGVGSSRPITSPSYTFISAGTYSVRICTDKTSSAGGGVITELDENNNCGAWTDVTVGTPPSPVINDFSADPNPVDFGSPTDLDWSSSNSTDCYLDDPDDPGDDPGTSVGTSGTLPVTPLVTTDYRLTCVGNSEQVSQTITVSVGAVPAKKPIFYED